MKGIIVAGGTGSRLKPITLLINKNLLPIYNKPGIYYAIELFRDAGINEICIVAESNYIIDFKHLLGNGTDFRVKLSYENDTPIRKGPASAVYYAKDFADGDSVAVIFADGNYDFSIRPCVESFTNGAKIFVKEVPDPRSFGIAEINSGKVISVVEKPQDPKSNFAVTGLGLYDRRIFDYIEKIQPGPNGEFYMTSVDAKYLETNELQAEIIDGFWQDVGTFDGMLTASNYWYKKNHNKSDSDKFWNNI